MAYFPDNYNIPLQCDNCIVLRPTCVTSKAKMAVEATRETATKQKPPLCMYSGGLLYRQC